MDAKQLVAALGELAESKSITPDAVITAFKDALVKAYLKYLGGGDDADVRCEFDVESGTLELGQVKTVVKDVEDDYIQISVEDANEGLKKAKYKVGDDFYIPASIDDLKKATALAVKSNFRARLGEAERSALYEIYKDHIGEMITGRVEKAEDRLVTVNIGRTNVELSRREMIGDETFKQGEPIKVYIEEVKTAEVKPGEKKRGPQIQVTRSSEGFLKRLFEEEIHEIYEGTVLIKGIVRMAGVRSKVAVATTNEDIDPTGACIGTSGSRIQRIVSQLGNGKDKEKIDIIPFSDNEAVYIVEAMRPATVVGVNLTVDENGKKQALVIIKDHSTSLAIGKKSANLKLASQLTGYSLRLVEETAAAEEGIVYTTTEEWKAQAEAEKAVKSKELYFAKTQAEAARKAAEMEALKAAVAPKTGASAEEFPAEAANPALAALEVVKAEEAAKRAVEARAAERKAFSIPPVEQPKPAEEAPVAETAEEAPAEKVEVKPTTVTTTTTLDALEKELASSKETKQTPVKSKKPRKITEEEVSHVTPTEPITPKAAQEAMAIYTQEELEAMEKEDEEFEEGDNFEEEVDYEDYDQYYDDNK